MPPAAPALTQVVAAPAAQRPVREANRWRGSGGTGRFPRLLAGRRCTEPNPTLAGIALHIHDPLERDPSGAGLRASELMRRVHAQPARAARQGTIAEQPKAGELCSPAFPREAAYLPARKRSFRV